MRHVLNRGEDFPLAGLVIIILGNHVVRHGQTVLRQGDEGFGVRAGVGTEEMRHLIQGIGVDGQLLLHHGIDEIEIGLGHGKAGRRQGVHQGGIVHGPPDGDRANLNRFRIRGLDLEKDGLALGQGNPLVQAGRNGLAVREAQGDLASLHAHNRPLENLPLLQGVDRGGELLHSFGLGGDITAGRKIVVVLADQISYLHEVPPNC